jgi:hypothetical protein
MLTKPQTNFSTQYLCDEIARLGTLRKPNKFWLVVPLILAISFGYQLLSDVEYAGQDPTIRGLRIFSWLKNFLPARPVNPDDERLRSDLPLFTNGIYSIYPGSIRQGGVYDCRFLAALASFAATERGRNTIFNMVKANADSTYTVTFPGAKNEPITVAPLSGKELEVYASAVGPNGFSAGIWLPVVEKAYGTYLDRHQSEQDKIFHALRHAVMEGRWSSSPELPGFAASFGAKDERGCIALTGHDMKQLRTTTLELGEFGLGKGYVTGRQIASWFDRKKVESLFYNEQMENLRYAFEEQRIVTATTGMQDAEAYGLLKHHAYAVLEYDVIGRRILIRDVLNASNYALPGTMELRGIELSSPFWVKIPDFNRCFSELSIEESS